MSQKKRHLVAAALIYANGPIHIGHLAGCYIPSDLYVRFLRSKGEDVKFISGTDEHGVPITIKARDEKKSPQEVVDYYYNLIDNSFKEFGISFDIFSRTINLRGIRINFPNDPWQDFNPNVYSHIFLYLLTKT